MKILLTAGAALLLVMSAMLATDGVARAASASGTAGATAGPIVVTPGEQKTNGDVVVTNGDYDSQYPQYAHSRGKIRIKNTATGTEVKCDGSVQARIDDIDAGDTVIVSTNSNPVHVNGTGGDVSVGSGSTVTISNTSAPGGTSITATLPGGSVVTILPGMTVPIMG